MLDVITMIELKVQFAVNKGHCIEIVDSLTPCGIFSCPLNN